MINLIIPPSPYLKNDRVFVSLGILYVASVLEKNGYRVKVTDLKGSKDWQTRIIEATHADTEFFGITSVTPDFPITLQIFKTIKSVNKNTPVIIGGAHAIVAPEQCSMFDKVVSGDGTTGILLALGNSKEKVIRPPLTMNLDELPFPSRHLIDLKTYNYDINGRKATNVMSQFGCPFSCVFCCGRNIPFYRKVRFRSPKNFVEELDQLNKDYGYGAFMIHDDEFNLDKARTLQLCGLMEKRNYIFRGFVRTDLFTEEIAKAMAKAGFYEVDVGIESGSMRILKLLNKHTSPEINSRARKLAAKYGMKFKAFVTVGHPSESREDIALTKEWLIENSPDAFEVYMVTPYPGAPIFDQKDKYDIEFSIDYSRDDTAVTRSYGQHKCLVRNSNLSEQELALLREELDKQVREKLGLLS